jgi:UDPglucose 6-dehydrogenase
MQRNVGTIGPIGGNGTIGRIGIIGAGVVGGALLRYLRERRMPVAVYDPPKGHTSVTAIADASVVFVCVPTPYVERRGFDDGYLVDAVRAVPGSKTVVIKSTVLPGTTDLLQERFPQHRFLFNPEFLREATAYEDFVNADRQIVGHTPASREDAAGVMALLPRAPFERICRAREAEMAKYAANSFLAVKVSYANEIYDLCDRLDIDYGAVRDMLGADARIAGSHLDVFAGGYRGYGGKCLPKDSRSLLDLARTAGFELQVLAAADRVNRAMLADTEAPRRLEPVAVEDAAIAERAA